MRCNVSQKMSLLKWEKSYSITYVAFIACVARSIYTDP